MAARIGVVQDVLAPEELLPAAYALAREMAANAPLAVQAIKRSVDTFADRGLAEAMGQAARRAAEFEGK